MGGTIVQRKVTERPDRVELRLEARREMPGPDQAIAMQRLGPEDLFFTIGTAVWVWSPLIVHWEMDIMTWWKK